MLWAYTQQLDPLKDKIFWSPFWSTVLAAVPVIVLFWLLVPRRWLAPKAGAAGAVAAIVIAILFFNMPADLAAWSFVHGAAFGLLPVGWTIFNAMLFYNITVETGQFTVVRRSVAELSGDARIQAVLIGFSFGAFLEGAAGGGTPVAICGAIMVGLGFNPFLAAVLCLIANTSPVAYGGLGTPLIVLNGVTDLPIEKLSTMAGHQLPFLSVLIPLWMVKCMCTWKQTFEIWPALLVSGGSFAIFQYAFATMHDHVPGVVLYPMTDIGGGIFSLVVTAIFLKFWKPKTEFRFDTPVPTTAPGAAVPVADAHAAEAAALVGPQEPANKADDTPLTAGKIALAWAPFALMSVFLMLTGLVRQKEGEAWFKVSDTALEKLANDKVPAHVLTSLRGLKDELFVTKEPFLEALEERLSKDDFKNYKKKLLARCEIGVTPGDGRVGIPGTDITTNYQIAIPGLHKTVYRDPSLIEEGKESKAEGALFNFAWLTAPGTAVFFAVIASMILLRMDGPQIKRVLVRTCFQMKVPIPTIAFMLGLSYVTRYSGMDATLGYAFAMTGLLYPFFAGILGWLGVFLTGTDAGSNALFGSLQKITATEIYNDNASLFAHPGSLDQEQLQVLICTANSTGGVMGKMIDAQSICVATAATHQIGKEADIFKAVVWHSIILASIIGIMTLLQAYVFPFTGMVPP